MPIIIYKRFCIVNASLWIQWTEHSSVCPCLLAYWWVCEVRVCLHMCECVRFVMSRLLRVLIMVGCHDLCVVSCGDFITHLCPHVLSFSAVILKSACEFVFWLIKGSWSSLEDLWFKQICVLCSSVKSGLYVFSITTLVSYATSNFGLLCRSVYDL